VTPSTIHVKDSIAAKMLKIVFSIYLLVAMLVTGFHMVAEYYNTKETIYDELKVIQRTIGTGLCGFTLG